MSYTYANRKRGSDAASKKAAAQQPSMDALRAGTVKPTSEQMGHRVDLPDAMRSKMENAFGADLSAVKLYESKAVADAGAKAISQGSRIAFAPGMLDFTSFGGQSLLGHEISHVVSQARGEVTGGGFLNDHALEARADREGAMAARGEQVAMPSAAMSAVSAAGAAGPMQAKKPEQKRERITEKPQAQIPQAENEADRLSASVNAGSPDEVKAEMGRKMGADFSGVNFHMDDHAAAKADSMGARAYTSGSDVYFDSEGFDPGVAAHELVHTVQQGVVSGSAETVSTPAGGIQMETKTEAAKRRRPTRPAPTTPPAQRRTPPPVPTAPHPPVPTRRPPTTPPAQQQQQTPPAAPPAEEEGTSVSDVMEAASFLPGHVNDSADKAGDFLEEQSAIDRYGKDQAEVMGGRAGLTKNIAGLMTNTMGTIGAASGVKEKREALEKAKKSGSQTDVTDAKNALIDQAAELGENSYGTLQSGVGFFSDAAEETMGDVADWFSLAKNGYGFFRGMHMYRNDSQIRDAMAAGRERVNGQQQPLTQNQALMSEMYDMAQKNYARRATDDKFDMAEAGAGLIGGGAGMAASAAGGKLAADLTTKLVTAGIKGSKKMVHEYQEDKDQREVLDRQIGLGQEVGDLRQTDTAKRFQIDPEYYEQAVIRSKGAASGEVGELYNMQARKKVEEFRKLNPQTDEEAAKFLEAGRLDASAPDLDTGLYHTVGGTDKEYEDRDADPFQAKAEKHAAIKAAGGYRKHYAKKIREGAASGWNKFTTGLGNAWQKTKTGVGNAASAVKDFATNAETRRQALQSVKTGAANAWEKTKTGAANAAEKVKAGAANAWEKTKTGVGNAASAVKDFATNAETRKKALEAVKAAPGRAVEKVKSGAHYAGEVIGHKAKSIRAEHHKAMDQLNEHRANYEGMNWADRAKWTLQNPLARIRMATKSGREAADNRLAQKLQAEEVRAYEEEQKRKKGGA